MSTSNRVVDAVSLPRWRDTNEKSESSGLLWEKVERSPFPVDDVINAKLALWKGDISRLKCAAVRRQNFVVSVGEYFLDSFRIPFRLFARQMRG